MIFRKPKWQRDSQNDNKHHWHDIPVLEKDNTVGRRELLPNLSTEKSFDREMFLNTKTEKDIRLSDVFLDLNKTCQEAQTNTEISFISENTSFKPHDPYYFIPSKLNPNNNYTAKKSYDVSPAKKLWKELTFTKHPTSLSRLRENNNLNYEKPLIYNRTRSSTPKIKRDYSYQPKKESEPYLWSILKESNPLPKMTPSYSVKKFDFPKVPKKYRTKSKRSSRYEFISTPKKFNSFSLLKDKKKLSTSPIQHSVRKL